MANHKRLELSDTEINLLKISAGDLIPILQGEEDYVYSVKSTAFDYFDVDSNKIFQVHVSVTRRESEFIPPFTTEFTKIG